MKPKTKKMIRLLFFWGSVLFFVLFGVAFVLFVWKTSESAPSFAEAVKQTLLFYRSGFQSAGILAAGIVCAGAAVKLAEEKRHKKAAGRLFIAEMAVFGLMVIVIVSMHVIV